MRVNASSRVSSSAGVEEQLVGREHRPLDVVAALLVSLGHHARGAFHRAGDVAAPRTTTVSGGR